MIPSSGPSLENGNGLIFFAIGERWRCKGARVEGRKVEGCKGGRRKGARVEGWKGGREKWKLLRFWLPSIRLDFDGFRGRRLVLALLHDAAAW